MARALADRWLRRAEAAVETLDIALGWRWLDVSVGDLIVLEGRSEQWRVVRRTVRGLLVQVSAELVPAAQGVNSIASDAGRALAAPVAVAGPTRLAVFETPVPLVEGGACAWISAGGGPGWRGARVSVLAGGEEFAVGDAQAVLAAGVLESVLPPGPSTMWDEANVAVVRLVQGSPALETRSHDAVLGGANLVRIGHELIQFREVLPLGDGVVQLGGLLRGRYGTGFESGGHPAGSPFLQVRPDRLLRWRLRPDMIGADLALLAAGPGDVSGGVEAAIMVEGLGLGPLASAHVSAEREPDGTLRTRWVSRHRDSFAWGAPEPPAGRTLWRFEAADGRVVEQFVEGAEFTLSMSEQVALFGALLPAGVICVIAVGDGPLPMRMSRPFAI